MLMAGGAVKVGAGRRGFLPGPADVVGVMSAADVGDLGLHNVQAVISGLPLLSMPLPLQTAILGGSFAQLARDARYVQFTYGWTPPVARALRDDMGLGWERSARIWFNMPPARVYRFFRNIPTH